MTASSARSPRSSSTVCDSRRGRGALTPRARVEDLVQQRDPAVGRGRVVAQQRGQPWLGRRGSGRTGTADPRPRRPRCRARRAPAAPAGRRARWRRRDSTPSTSAARPRSSSTSRAWCADLAAEQPLAPGAPWRRRLGGLGQVLGQDGLGDQQFGHRGEVVGQRGQSVGDRVRRPPGRTSRTSAASASRLAARRSSVAPVCEYRRRRRHRVEFVQEPVDRRRLCGRVGDVCPHQTRRPSARTRHRGPGRSWRISCWRSS